MPYNRQTDWHNILVSAVIHHFVERTPRDIGDKAGFQVFNVVRRQRLLGDKRARRLLGLFFSARLPHVLGQPGQLPVCILFCHVLSIGEYPTTRKRPGQNTRSRLSPSLLQEPPRRENVVIDNLGVRQLQILEAGYIGPQPRVDRGNGAIHKSAVRPRLRQFGQYFLGGDKPVCLKLTFRQYKLSFLVPDLQTVLLGLALHVATAQSGHLLQ